MLTHIVVWKYRSDASEEERQRHVEMLRRLPGIISETESFSIGRDVLHLPRSYDTGLTSTFRDRAALDAYSAHPEHVTAADFGRKISEHIVSVDFEDEEQAS